MNFVIFSFLFYLKKKNIYIYLLYIEQSKQSKNKIKGIVKRKVKILFFFFLHSKRLFLFRLTRNYFCVQIFIKFSLCLVGKHSHIIAVLIPHKISSKSVRRVKSVCIYTHLAQILFFLFFCVY